MFTKPRASESAGHQVSGPPAAFDVSVVENGLAGMIFHGRLHHFPSINSTQTRAIAEAQAGAEAGQVYIADEQTAGRGRGGHAWHSEPERGLYLTALVRPRLPAEQVLLISLATGLAAQEAILQVSGYDVDLRWPNDLVTRKGGRKLGGILTETAMDATGALRYAAIGIGINLNQSEMPGDLAAIASSLLLECGARTRREDLAVALLIRLHQELRVLEKGAEQVLQRFAERSSWVCGKAVQVAEDEGYTGVTAGLTAEGLLRMQCTDGSERVIRHGGVREL